MSPAETILASARSRQIEIVLDLSRLLSRCLHDTPTGVDRVEMAYARHLLALLPEVLAFSAVHPLAGYGRLSPRAVLRFLDETEARWAREAPPRAAPRYARAFRDLWRLRPKRIPPANVPRYLIQASPNHLHRRSVVRAKLRREVAYYICLVHDLIPIEFPEYARPGGAGKHIERMATLAACADLLVANSAATAETMANFLATQDRSPPVFPVLLGTAPKPPGAATGRLVAAAKPYFLILGTIEPRKNHLLLLNIWREMVRTAGAAATPLLVIIGRRGWENENVLDMIERSELIRDHVVELSQIPDAEVEQWLNGARALLMPSFAEGFGMPVAEAMIAGTPIICSDIPALREVGGDVPDYISPLDGAEWMAAIRDYCSETSQARMSQIARLGHASLPTWDEHVMGVLSALATLPAKPEALG